MDEETAEALTRTKALYDAGVLTDEEWLAKKNELLRAQPPADEDGGVVEGHVVAPRAQRIHPEPRANEVHAATRIQAKARQSAAWKDFPLPPGATSATRLQGWWCVHRR